MFYHKLLYQRQHLRSPSLPHSRTLLQAATTLQSTLLATDLFRVDNFISLCCIYLLTWLVICLHSAARL